MFGCMHAEIGEPLHRLSNRQQLHGQAYSQAIRAVHKWAILNSALPSSSPSQTESSLVHKLINPTLQLLVHCIRHFLHQGTGTCQACAANTITHTHTHAERTHTHSRCHHASCACASTGELRQVEAGRITKETINKVSHALQQASKRQCDEQAMWAPAAWGIWWQQRLAW